MGNCLVTKLKGTVDNDSLKKLGCITIELPAGKTGTVSYLPGSDASVSVLSGDGTYTLSNNIFSLVGGTTNTVYLFNNKYQIYNVNCQYPVLDLDEMSYMTELVSLNAIYSTIKGNIENIKEYSKLESLTFNNATGQDLHGDIDFLDSLTHLTTITLPRYDVENVTLSGSFPTSLTFINLGGVYAQLATSAFSSLVNLATLSIRSGQSISGSIEAWKTLVNLTTLVLGTSMKDSSSIESLLAGMYNDGSRHSGTLYINATAANVITFNGAIATVEMDATFSANGITIVNHKTSATLATYDGTTWTYNS